MRECKQTPEAQSAIYEQRRDVVCAGLDKLGWTYDRPHAGMFVWAKIPPAYADGYALSDRILHGAGVFITPGGIFGPAGEGYVRVSLCSTTARLQDSIDRIQKEKI